MASLLDSDAGTERFGSYEADLKLVQADVNQKLDQIPELAGEPRKAAVRQAERALEEAREIVRPSSPRQARKQGTDARARPPARFAQLDQMRIEKPNIPAPAKSKVNARFRNLETDVDGLGRRAQGAGRRPARPVWRALLRSARRRRRQRRRRRPRRRPARAAPAAAVGHGAPGPLVQPAARQPPRSRSRRRRLAAAPSATCTRSASRSSTRAAPCSPARATRTAASRRCAAWRAGEPHLCHPGAAGGVLSALPGSASERRR